MEKTVQRELDIDAMGSLTLFAGGVNEPAPPVVKGVQRPDVAAVTM